MTSKRKYSATFILFLFIPFLYGASTDGQKIITSCGESKGFSYYLKTDMTKDDAGWQKDSITSGNMIFVIREDQPDILSRDATQKTISKKESGANVVYTQNIFFPAMYTVYVVFPEGDMEHYIFNLDKSGNGEVVWGSVRGGGWLPKSSIYKAKCKK